MTDKEAVEIIKIAQAEVEWDYPLDYAAAFGVAIEALEDEKRTPKKVIYQEQYYGTPYRCPLCEADLAPVRFFTIDGSKPKEKVSYCWQCGQKIDWSEE